jgi:glycerophosphoryl diester phosphodiesterase
VPPSPWSFLDHPGPLAFAHRGGAAEVPENTMRAFEHAVGLGYTFLETDARITADGVVLAFHDAHLRRLTGRPGAVSDLTWRELAEARVDGEPIPRMEDVLGAWPHVRLNIDPKQDAAVAPLAEIIRRTGTTDRVCLASFSGRRLAWMRRLLGPDVCTSLGPLGIARLRVASLGLPVGALPAACTQVPVSSGPIPIVDKRLVGTAHDRGVQVHVWTCDDEAEMHRLLDLGVDGLMTDRPTLLKEVLTARGQWV